MNLSDSDADSGNEELTQNSITNDSNFSFLHHLVAKYYNAESANQSYEQNVNQHLKTCPIIPIPKILNPIVKNKRIIDILYSLNFKHSEDVRKRDHVQELISMHQDIFYVHNDTIDCINYVKHYIYTKGVKSIQAETPSLPAGSEEFVNKEIDYLLKNNIIKKSNSSYNSPLRIIPKTTGSETTWQLDIDYSLLNENTWDDPPVLPNTLQFDRFANVQYFSVFNILFMLSQIPIVNSHTHKTAFSTPNGHYEFIRTLPCLKNTMKTIHKILYTFLEFEKRMFIYLDNIIICAASLAEHKISFNRLANILRLVKLKLRPQDCKFLEKEIIYNSFMIDEEGMKIDPKHISLISKFPTPQTMSDVVEFLQLMIRYKQFIPNFFKLILPLSKLLNKKFYWLSEQMTAFQQLQNSVSIASVLQHPHFDKTFTVTVEADDDILRATLSQEVTNHLPISHTSRTLSQNEMEFSIVEKDLFAIMHSLRIFYNYIYKDMFVLVINYRDLKPLEWLDSLKMPLTKFEKIKREILKYNFDVLYHKRTDIAEASKSAEESAEGSGAVPSFLDQYYEKEGELVNYAIRHELLISLEKNQEYELSLTEESD